MKPLAVAPAQWDAFVHNHAYGHLLQLSGWGALKARFGWRTQTLALADSPVPHTDAHARVGDLRAGALLLYKRTLGLTLAYVPRGPVVDWRDRALVAETLAHLRAAAHSAGASVLKVEPELPDTAAHRALLVDLGLRPSTQTIQPRSTIQLDLSDGPEAALARMKSKWRYNVRLAERKGVVVRVCRAEEMAVVGELMAATAARDRFDVHETAYYASAQSLLAPDHLTFLLAEYAGQPLGAIAVGATAGLAWYLWGASSNLERNRMPNHALQWAGLQWAHAHGATRYDMWGIPDEIGALAQGMHAGDGSGTPSEALPIDLERLPESGLWGVYRFKQGFGGNVVRMVGAWDLPVRPAGDLAYRVGLQALRIRRELADQRASASGEQTSLPSAPAAAASAPAAAASKSAWRKTLAALPAPHVLQSWEWGDVKAQTGWRAERLVLEDGASAFQFLTRQPVAGLPLRIGYVPKGPVVDWRDGARVERTLDALQQHARARGCMLVKIDPDVAEASPEGARLLASLRQRGWRFSNEQIQFKNTGVSDLRGDEAQLLDGMKSKTRYNLRLSERRGISVRLGGEADLDAFHALYAETGARDGFLIRPLDYYRTTWQTFLRAQQEPGSPTGGALLLAEAEGETAPLAGLFLMRQGETAWYFYGASSERRRRDMPNYLLQWQALRWAKAQGCMRYDWWGAPTDPEDEGDAMQGVWSFKQGFGAELQRNIGAWDYPVWPPLYELYAYALPRALALLRQRAA